MKKTTQIKKLSLTLSSPSARLSRYIPNTQEINLKMKISFPPATMKLVAFNELYEVTLTFSQKLAQGNVVYDLYKLFDGSFTQFSGYNETKTIKDILDEYIQQMGCTVKEMIKINIAFGNIPIETDLETINFCNVEDVLQQYYSEELFQKILTPFLDMTIETMKRECYIIYEYYHKKYSCRKELVSWYK